MDPPSTDTRSLEPQSFTDSHSGTVLDIKSALSIIPDDDLSTPTNTTPNQGSVIHGEHIESYPSMSSHDSTTIEDSIQQREDPQLHHSKSTQFQSPSILRSASYASDSSSSSIPTTSNVTFAPLPSRGDKKRKNVQLGVGARSRMLQERKARSRQVQLHDDSGPPKHPWREPEPDDDTDPFVALGQFVKGASKTLWRKVSRKDLRASKTVQNGTDKCEEVEGADGKVPEDCVIEVTQQLAGSNKEIDSTVRATTAPSHNDEETTEDIETKTTTAVMQETSTPMPIATSVH